MSPEEYSEWLTLNSYYKDKFQKKKNAERVQINRQSSRKIKSSKKKSKARRKRAKQVQSHGVIDQGMAYIQQCIVEAGIKSSEQLLDFIENVALLYSGIENAANNLGVFTALLTYLKTHIKGSIFFELRELITRIMFEPDENQVEVQAGEETSEEKKEISSDEEDPRLKTNTEFQWNDKPEWLKRLKDFRANWAQARDSLFTTKLSKLLGLVVVLGLCDEENVKFDIAGFELISADLNVVHKKAGSVIDAVMDTVVYFVEVGYACWKHGSLNPLWSGMEDVTMDQRIADIRRWWDSCAVGNLQTDFGIDDREFSIKLEDAIVELERRKKIITRGMAHATLVRLHSQLMEIHNNFVDLKIAGGTRMSPMLLCFFGNTAQSKSFITEQVKRALLTSAGVEASERLWYTKNPGERFWSKYRSDMTSINWDDFCQGVADKASFNPWEDIFRIKNNVKCSLEMADLESKGRVFAEPELCTITTNSEWMQVKTWVTSPSAALRRIDYRIIVSTRPEFSMNGEKGGMLDEEKALLWRKANRHEPIDDIWLCTVQKFTPIAGASISALPNVENVRWRGRELKNIPAKLLLEFLTEKFLHHREKQKMLMNNKKLMCKTLQVCGIEGCRQLKGVCSCVAIQELKELDSKEVEAHSHLGNALYSVASTAACKYTGLFNGADYAASRVLLHQADRFWSRNGWYTLLPSSWVRNEKFQKLMMITNQRSMFKHYIRATAFNWLGALASSMPLMYALKYQWVKPKDAKLIFGSLVAYTSVRQMGMVDLAKQNFVDELIETNESVEVISLEERDRIAKGLLGASAIALSAYALVKFIRNCKQSSEILKVEEQPNVEGGLNAKKPEPHGVLTPSSPAEVDEREVTKDQWSKVHVKKLPKNVDTSTMTIDQLMNIVGKNLYYCNFVDHKMFVNALFLDTNICILPNHVFEIEGKSVDNLKCIFSKFDPEVNGGRFSYTVSKIASYHLPGTDLRMVYVGGGGDHKNLFHLFPKETLPLGKTYHGKIRFRTKEGKFLDGNIAPTVARVGHAHCSDFKGGKYQAKTFSGLCGAPILSDTTVKQLVGVHLGGVSEIEYGIYGEITLPMLKNAYDKLDAIPGVRLGGSSGTYKNNILGKDIVVSAHGPEPKSPMNYLPVGTQLEYFGQCSGKTTPRSDVRKTPISPYIFDIMGVQNQWGKPSMKPAWKPYQTCMANISEPAHNFEHESLIWAIEDYTGPVYPLFEKPMWKCDPLTHRQTLNGIHGSRFMKGMDFSTSIGYPLTGPKSQYADILIDENGVEYREFHPFILEHLREVGEVYERGERFYAVCKGCTKDEATPLEKDKCRIFFANPISLVYYVRKYFLPIARVFMLNPIVCECAVGVNSHGPEWEELDNHRKKFPNIFGGDYSKYDQNIPSQMVNAAFDVLIQCAKRAGYDNKSIKIMEAIASDVVYAMINFNGDLVRLLVGAMISGNSLTVIINGIEGSLNVRVVFYHEVIIPRRRYRFLIATNVFFKEDFRTHVSLITYGDDNDGSVADTVAKEFNIETVSKFLGKYGQKYTMPDKSTKLRPFLLEEESDFLCRRTVYIPEIDAKVGALDEKSIFKSLHVHTYGKKEALTRNEKVCAAAESAMIEWFNHGREKYETRRSQLKEVMRRADLLDYCHFLDDSFDDRVEKWRKNYGSDSSS